MRERWAISSEVALVLTFLLWLPAVAQSQTRTVVEVKLDARSEVAAALYAASATQVVAQRVSDAKIRAQRIEIERVRAPVHAGVARLQAALTAAEETYVAAPASRDRADTQEIAGGLGPIRA